MALWANCNLELWIITFFMEHMGSVVGCLSWDLGVADLSLTGRNVLCPWARHFNNCLVLVQPGKTHPDITDMILYVPVNNLLVMSGLVFKGWTSTKQGLMCLAQGHNTVAPVRLEPAALQSRVKQSCPLSLFHMEILTRQIRRIYIPRRRVIWEKHVNHKT